MLATGPDDDIRLGTGVASISVDRGVVDGAGQLVDGWNLTSRADVVGSLLDVVQVAADAGATPGSVGRGVVDGVGRLDAGWAVLTRADADGRLVAADLVDDVGQNTGSLYLRILDRILFIIWFE